MNRRAMFLLFIFSLLICSCSEQDDLILPESIEEAAQVKYSPRILFSYNVSDGTDNSESILIDNKGQVLRLRGESVRINQGDFIPDVVLQKWENSAELIEGIKIDIEELTTKFHALEPADKLVYRSSLEKENSSYTTSLYGYESESAGASSDQSSASECSKCTLTTSNIRPILLEQTSEGAITQSNESTVEIADWFKFISEDLIDLSQFTD